METESKNQVEEVLKTPDVDQESKAVEANRQSSNGNDLELHHDSFEDERNRSAKSPLDDTLSRNPDPPHQNTETTDKLNTRTDESEELENKPTCWRNMSYNEQRTFICFRQAGVSYDEAIEIINEVRQERGIPELTESREEQPNEMMFKDCRKVPETCMESTLEVIGASDVDYKAVRVSAPLSADVLVLSSSDDESDNDSSNPNSSKDQQIAPFNKGGVNSKSRWIRHSDCKHTKEELKKMAQQIQTKRLREKFVYRTYCRGVDPNEQLKYFLDQEANKPRVELRKMSKLLPKKLRSEFYCRAMKRNNPHTLMRKYLSMPQNQQWLLCKRLKLSDTKLLFTLFQQPGQKSNNSVSRPLKEWFNIFLQEGSVEEALGKVRKLILQGAVAKKNTAAEIAPNDVALANQSGGAKSDAEVTSCRQFGRKSRTRRNKKFQQLNEDQIIVYNSWVEQGLSHQDALTIVLKFPGERRPTNRMNVCAWGECDKHPQQKCPKPPRRSAKLQPGATTPPLPPVGSESSQFRKPIFDRIPVPSVIVDTSSPLELPPEQQSAVPGSINNGASISPFVSHSQMAAQSELPSLTKPSPTLAMGSQGLRVPQKSTFVENSEPLKPVVRPTLDPLPVDPLHLCIVPEEYPKEGFSNEEFEVLENSISIAISGISDERMKPVFKKQSRNVDKYEMVCQDQLAKKWLHKYVACMHPVVPLKIIPAEPTKMKTRTVLPSCKNDDTDIIDEESAKSLKKCSKVGFRKGTGNIIVEDSNKLSNKASSRKSGARRALERTAVRTSQSDKRTSTSHSAVQILQKEQLPVPAHKNGNDSREAEKNLCSHSKTHVDQSGKNKSSLEPYKPRYIGRRRSHEYKGSKERHESDPVAHTTTSSKHNVEDKNVGMRRRSAGYTPSGFEPPDCQMTQPWFNPGIDPRFTQPPGMPPRFFHPPGMPPRFPHPPGMPPMFAHPTSMPPRFPHPPVMPPRFAVPPGVPPRFAHPPGMPPRFPHPPGMPPRFAHPMFMPPMYVQSGPAPSNGFFLERPTHLEQIPEVKATRSPSPDFDELLKSARSRLKIPDEPTDTSKLSSSEHPKQARSQHPANGAPSVKRTADRSSSQNKILNRINGRSIKRNHSPKSSLYSSRSRPRKRSDGSPPPTRPSKSSRWN